MQSAEIEQLFLRFLVTLPVEMRRKIINHSISLLDTIDEETENEIKEELWHLAKYAINTSNLIEELKELDSNSDSDESE